MKRKQLLSNAIKKCTKSDGFASFYVIGNLLHKKRTYYKIGPIYCKELRIKLSTFLKYYFPEIELDEKQQKCKLNNG